MDGARLKKVRKDRRYTQVSLADALDVSKSSVAMWETCKRNPEFDTLEELLSLLDVSYDYLSGKSDVEGHDIGTKESLQQVAAWTIADNTYDIIKKYLALDSYGSYVVEQLIMSEYRRFVEQKTIMDTSDYTVNVSFKPDSISVPSEE